MLKGKKELYGFGPFKLDVSEHRLERDDGVEVGSLPEKAFQTLVVLVRNAGSLVTKEQLLDEVWPDTIVEENNLDKCIYTIRHSLGDSPGQHRYIETVRKHGYRFVGEVRQVDDIANLPVSYQVASNGDDLAGVLRAASPEPTIAADEANRNAFEACQQARIKYDQMTAPTTIEARELVTKALRLNPDFALAHSFSAELTTLEIIVGMKWPGPGFAEARASIARAQELGDDSANFYASAAYVDLLADWNFAAAEEKLQTALAKNAYHSVANRMLGETYMFQGNHTEAAVYIDRAQVETGLHNTYILGMSRFLARDYPAVLEVCDRMLEFAPNHLVPAVTKCWALEQVGRVDEAVADYVKILRLEYGEAALRWIGYAYALAGDRELALDTASRLESASKEHNLSPTHLAAIYAGLGEIDQAVSYIQSGLEINDPWMLWVPTDPRFDNLRKHDRFIEIKDRVLEKVDVQKAVERARRPKEIRLMPSVQDGGHGFQNEPIISTATTPSGAFVIAAKWRPPGTSFQQPQPPATPKSSFAGRILPTFALAVLALVAAVAIYFLVTGAKVFEPKSIAILPFKPIDSNIRDELYEIGIPDSLIQRLGGVESLVVRPLGATRKYADLQQDPVTAGKEQQVNYVLSANYQVSDGKVRVTAQLHNVETGQIEESITGESGNADMFAMQDAIADQIGKVLTTRFSSAPPPSPRGRGTANEEAYRLYLQGKYFYSQRTLPASKTAVELFERAVQLDPQYALAWAGKAHAHRFAGNLGLDTDTHVEYKRSIEAINIALSINKDLSEAHSALCENKYYYEFDFGGAEAECKRAIALDPNSSIAHEIYGRFLYHRGRFNEGTVEINTAIALDPASRFNQRNLGIAYYYSGRYEEAEAQLKRVIAMDPTFAAPYMWLRNSLEMQQKHPEAFEWFIKAQKLLGTDENIIRRYEAAYAESGYTGMMREHAKFADTYNQYYIGGILNAQIGDKDKAFEYLEKSYQRREWGMNSLLIEPQLEPLRSDPRFKDLVKRVGLN